MALQYVGGNSGTWVGSTSVYNTISLTSLTGGISSYAAAGDIVIAAYGNGSTVNNSLTIGTADYTVIATKYSDASVYDTNLRVAYKVLSANDVSVSFGPTGSAGMSGSAVVHVWRNVDTTTIFDVAATSAVGITLGRPNPPAITPVTSGTIILAIGAAASSTGALFTSSLDNFITATSAGTVDSIIGIGSTVWTSGQINPAQWGGGTSLSSDSWAAVTLALRPSAGSASQTLGPPLVTNTQTFFGPTVSCGAVSLAPSLLTNSQAFYGSTVAAGAVALSPSLLSNTQVFYGQTVAPGSASLQPSLLINTQAFYATTVAPGSVGLSPSLVGNSQTFYSPVVSGGGAVTLSAPLISNAQSFFAPAVTPGAVSIAPALLTNVSAVFAPTVSQSAINLQPSVVGPTSSVFAPTVQAGALTIAPQRLDNTSAVYSPVATAVSTLSPGLLASFNSFFAPTISSGATVLSPPLLASGSKIFAPSIGNQLTDIYRLLANRQELDPAAGKFRVYADDGVTIFMEADAWEDAAGTIRFRGVGLARIDRLMPYVQ